MVDADENGHPLTDADACACYSKTAAATGEVIHRVGDDPCHRCPEWMSQRDGAAFGVDLLRRDLVKLAQIRQDHCGECLVDLPDINLCGSQGVSVEQAASSKCRRLGESVRRNCHSRTSEEFGLGCEPSLDAQPFTCEDHGGSAIVDWRGVTGGQRPALDVGGAKGSQSLPVRARPDGLVDDDVAHRQDGVSMTFVPGVRRQLKGGVMTRRIVVAKPGLDGHDRGAKVVARVLRDAGNMVIYTGLRQSPESIVNVAVQEDADAIGLSVLSGAHMALFGRVLELLDEHSATDIVVFGGGIIPSEDVSELEALGVARIFTPGTSSDDISQWVHDNIRDNSLI